MSKTINRIIFILIALSLIILPVQAVDVTACGNLDSDGETYNLINNVSSAGTCFIIGAHNITLDGHGFEVNFSQSVDGYGIRNIAGYDNITIKNLNIVQGMAIIEYAHGIHGFMMSNSRITNNTIITSGSDSYGIYIDESNSNEVVDNVIITLGNWSPGIYLYSIGSNITNNTIITSGSDSYGIFVYLSSLNVVKNGSIISDLSYDYCLLEAGGTNNFINTNFTAQRKIYFVDVISRFNYNDDDGNIWLKNNVSSSTTISRTLINWHQTNITWSDSATVTAYYNISGLLPNTNYSIINNSELSYNLTTDEKGNLPLFTIALNGDTEIKVFIPPVNIFGYIVNNLEYPLQNARVDIENIFTFTDINGYYMLSTPAGNHTVLVRAIGYFNSTIITNFTDNVTLNFTLSEWRTAMKVPGFEGIGLITIIVILFIIKRKQVI